MSADQNKQTIFLVHIFLLLKFLALTAHAMAGDRERFLKAGMTDYLSKPIDMNELKNVIARVMAK
jgi:CheY-like chemotaxis protein